MVEHTLSEWSSIETSDEQEAARVAEQVDGAAWTAYDPEPDDVQAVARVEPVDVWELTSHVWRLDSGRLEYGSPHTQSDQSGDRDTQDEPEDQEG